MKDQNDISGQTITMTGAEAIRRLARNISEGFQSGVASSSNSAINLFGRSVHEEKGADLSFLSGLATSGLRTSAFLCGPELASNQNQLNELVRQHLPVIIYYALSQEKNKTREPLSSWNALHAAAAGGSFQFMAADLQETIDLALVAHKVAERSLIPGICAMDGQGVAWKEDSANIPTASQLRRFLGDPDDHILSATPAQEMIFGKDRRRIPHWFNLDTPVMSGMSKDPLAMDLEAAAQVRFFNEHLPQVIEEVMDEYGKLSGRGLSFIQGHNTQKAEYLLLTSGHLFHQVKQIVDQIRRQDKIKIGCLNITVLRPFPEKQLLSALKGVKAVTVLEGFSGYQQGDTPLFREVKASIQGLGKQAPRLFSALYGQTLSAVSLHGIVKNMMSKNEQKARLFLGIDFARNTSTLPQHELLLQSIRRAYPDITSESISDGQQATRASSQQAFNMPFSVRKYRDEGPAYTQLSRFYHHTACFYQKGIAAELVADPYQALPIAPAATAGFAPLASQREFLPVFLPQNCTGCGECFTYCPHSAIPPISIGLESLIRGGMDIAAQQGTPVTGLTPMVKNLAKVAGTLIKEQKVETTYIRDFLPAAFNRLAEQMKLSGEKLENAQQEMRILNSCLGEFPLAVTDLFFKQPEIMEKGNGEFFSLSVDPFSCTGCGLCAESCKEEALLMQPSEESLETQLLQNQQIWQQLPDTPSDTIHRMIHSEDYDPFAATLLSRHFYLSTTGGATTEEGTASKNMTHLLTALTESIVQSRMAGQIKKVEQQITDLSANIHQHLSDALPHDDFHLLTEKLKGTKLPLEAVIRNLQSEEQPKLIDTPALQRKIALLNDLKTLHWELTEGPTGGGRARYGLSISDSREFSWADDYPYHPFTVPVIWHWEGAAPERLKGLMLGWRRHLIDNVRLLRRATLEIKDKYRPEIHDQEIGHLRWDQIEDHEQQLLSPLFLLGDRQLLSQVNSNGLLDLLLLDMPIKIVVLDAVNETSVEALSQANTALFAAMSLRNAQILRGGLANNQLLYEGLRDGIESLKPALFHILTPEPEEFFNQKWSSKYLSSLALQTRGFTVFRYDPDKASGYLAADIQIDANPDYDQNWVTSDLYFLKDGEEKTMSYTWTYADWLFAQKAWRSHFRRPESGENIVPMADFLNLELSDRSDKSPVIQFISEDGQLETYVAGPFVVSTTQNALKQWNSLREIAGALTPFPEKLHQQIKATLTAEHERSMSELKAAYEQKLKIQEQEMMEDMRQKLRDKLLSLSRRGKIHGN